MLQVGELTQWHWAAWATSANTFQNHQCKKRLLKKKSYCELWMSLSTKCVVRFQVTLMLVHWCLEPTAGTGSKRLIRRNALKSKVFLSWWFHSWCCQGFRITRDDFVEGMGAPVLLTSDASDAHFSLGGGSGDASWCQVVGLWLCLFLALAQIPSDLLRLEVFNMDLGEFRV